MTGGATKTPTRTGPTAAGAGFTVGRRLPGHAWALLLALLALAVRVLYLVESAANPFRHHLDLDPKNYHAWAQTILGGTPFGPEPFMQAPLYPYFLAGCYGALGVDTIRPLYVQALLGALTTYAGARIAGRQWGRTAMVVTGLILALYKPAIFYTGILLVPALATALLAGALWSAPRRPFLAGIFTGLAGLAHPTILLGGLLAVLGLIRRRRPALVVLLGALLTILPATLHNFVMSGRWVPMSANVGINLYIGNGPEANGFYASPFGMRGEQDPLGIREAERQAGRPLSMVAASRFWTARTLEAVRAAPGRTAALYVQKLHAALSSYETPQIESLDFEKRFSAWLRFPALPNWILLITLSAGALVLLRRNRFAWALGGGVLLTALMIAAFFVTARFRLPVHLFLALLAGGGLAAVGAGLKARSLRRAMLLRALALAGLAALLLAPNWLAIGKMTTFGQYHYRLGVIAEREGRLEDAADEYGTALAIDPNVARANINLGILKARQHDWTGAVDHLTRGIALDPRSARAYLALGQLREVRGELAAACSFYARAWAADTTFLPGLEFLAAARYVLGDSLVAEAHATGLTARAAGREQSARCTFMLSRMAERRHQGWPVWTSRERAQGDLALAAGNVALAEEFYRRAARRNSQDLAALLELARIARGRRDPAAATDWVALYLERGGPPHLVAGFTGGP